MKRNFVTFALAVILICGLFGTATAQGIFHYSTTENIAIADSGVVYNGSTAFDNYKYLWIKYMVCDTLAADSAQAHIYVKFTHNSLYPALFDTLTASSDSTWYIKEYGPDEHPMAPYIYFSAEGDSLTSKRYNLVKIMVGGYYEEKNK